MKQSNLNRKKTIKKNKKQYDQSNKFNKQDKNKIVKSVKVLNLTRLVTGNELAAKLNLPVVKIIQHFFNQKILLNPNQILTKEQIFEFCFENNIDLNFEDETNIEDFLEKLLYPDLKDSKQIFTRPPIITIMGHVDHGKTTLLDTIRKSSIVKEEVGGITQKIGAYQIIHNEQKITFIDTPGHEVFTEMRARGSKITDIAVIVIAADDSIMPQTKESIDHVRAANVPFIIAINKIDKEQADAEKVKHQLLELNVIGEEFGGEVPIVLISAKTGQGIDLLLETIILYSQMLDLNTDLSISGRGVIIESKQDKLKGVVSSLIVLNGIVKLNDKLITNNELGKIRLMVDDSGKSIKEAYPSTPIEILGLSKPPLPGTFFLVIKDEKDAKKLIKLIKNRQDILNANTYKANLKEDEKILNLIIKSDSKGSIEAIRTKINSLNNKDNEIKVNIIRSDVGVISQSDLSLAEASKAEIFAFNLDSTAIINKLIKERKLKVRNFNIVYELFDAVELLLKGMKEPEYEKEIIGTGEIRKVFSFSKIGKIAGCYIKSGKINDKARVTIFNNKKEIFDGEIASLKVEKNNVKEVGMQKECGITFKHFNDISENDTFEIYILKLKE